MNLGRTARHAVIVAVGLAAGACSPGERESSTSVPVPPRPAATSARPADQSTADRALALDHLREGRFTEAATVLERAVERDPGSGDLFNLLGFARLNRRDLGGAREALETASALSPESGDVAFNLGALADALGQFDRAEVEYRRAVGLDPRVASYHDALGWSIFQQAFVVLASTTMDFARVQAASDALEKAVELDPGIVAFRLHAAEARERLQDADGAAGHLRAAIAIEPGADALLRLARIEASRGRVAEALPHLRRALEIQPTLAEARYELGAALEKQRDLEGAASELRRAASDDPGLAKAWFRLAAVLRRLGRDEEADAAQARFDVAAKVVDDRDRLERAARASPGLATAQYNFGVVLGQSGRLDEARLQYERAIFLDPSMAAARSNLGMILLSKGDLDAAEAHFRRAGELDAGDGVARLGLGRTLLARGDAAGAVGVLRRAVELQPGSADAAVEFATALRLAGDLAGAARALETALRIAPTRADALHDLGGLCLDLNRPADAADAFRRLVALRPDDADAKRFLDAADRAAAKSR